MVEDPLDSGLGGEAGLARARLVAGVPLMGVTASLSGLLRRIDGLGDPGTVLSPASEAGMIGVILAGVIVAGATVTGWLSPAGGSVVMVTLLPLVSPGLSYISVVCEKLGMAMAGATAARDTDKLTGRSAPPVLAGAGTKVT